MMILDKIKYKNEEQLSGFVRQYNLKKISDTLSERVYVSSYKNHIHEGLRMTIRGGEIIFTRDTE